MPDRVEWEKLEGKLKVLHEELWEDKADGVSIVAWLKGFAENSEPNERFHALYLLSQAMYFGSRELRELLVAAYRDHVRYPIVHELRRSNGDSLDHAVLQPLLEQEVLQTRFLGIGNPSESGTHLLYLFRQVNGIGKKLFVNTHDLFTYDQGLRAAAIPNLRRVVFLDDFCGSGTQAKMYSDRVLAELKALCPTVVCKYIVLFGCSSGLELIRSSSLFDEVVAVSELDESYRVFGPVSRYFKSPTVDKSFAEAMSKKYGAQLCPGAPLGYDAGQLLLAFHHNTPDNALPILWYEGKRAPAWRPIFRRYPKLYGWGTP